MDLEYFPHQTDSIPVNVKYDPPVQFKSLVHYWSEWVSFPLHQLYSLSIAPTQQALSNPFFICGCSIDSIMTPTFLGWLFVLRTCNSIPKRWSTLYANALERFQKMRESLSTLWTVPNGDQVKQWNLMYYHVRFSALNCLSPHRIFVFLSPQDTRANKRIWFRQW